MALSRPPADPAPPPRFARSERYSLRVPTGPPRGAARRDQAAYWLAIGGPIGLIPWVPATWASLATAAVWYGLARVSVAWARGGPVAVAVVALLLVGALTATIAERLEHTTDPRNVVIDEIAGQSLAFLFVAPADWRLAAAGFVLFRICDVLKPPPARRLEQAPAGWGIMLDDLAAGLYAAGLLWLCARWF